MKKAQRWEHMAGVKGLVTPLDGLYCEIQKGRIWEDWDLTCYVRIGEERVIYII